MNTRSHLSELQKVFKEKEHIFLEEYFTFLRFKSISADPLFRNELLQCASWLKEKISSIGFTVDMWETEGNPILYAEYSKAGPDKPTILFYNHYDVQPVDPIDLWDTPPFEPTLKNNQIFARGAQDNKGQCMYVYQAFKTLLELTGELPVNIKWIIEGEEEVGSKNIAAILDSKKKFLQVDYLVIADMGIPAKDTPAVTLGVRGLVTMDVEATGSLTDLHSGTHGGRAFNPIHALTEILSKLRDSEGRITVPGFYDKVRELSAKDREEISFYFDADFYKETFGLIASGGEKSYTPLERSTIRPTLEINGISGGYSGVGFKTVIPAKAHAKISCRLVPDQDPDEIAKAVSHYITSLAPEGIKIAVNVHSGKGKAVRADSDSAIVKAFFQAYTDVFGKKCLYSFEGGSIPVASALKNACNAEIILVGLGLDSDNIHAPNEHFGWDRFEQGFRLIIEMLLNFREKLIR